MNCTSCIYYVERNFYGNTAEFCLKYQKFCHEQKERTKAGKCPKRRIIKECQNCDYYDPQTTLENSDGTCRRTNTATDYNETCKYFKE